MISDDFLFPHIVRLFAGYLRELDLTSEQAHEKGPFAFLKWLETALPQSAAAEDFEEESEEFAEPEEEGLTEDQEAAHIISHLVVSGDVDWLSPYWGRLITSFRKKSRNSVVEFHGTLVARWSDGYAFPFVCVVPEQFIQPQGAMSDSLMLHIAEVFASQFSDLLTDKSSDKLHDVQGAPTSKESLKKVLALATEAVNELPAASQPALQRALRFLRAVSLPALPPDALRSASRSLGSKSVSKTDWRVFPIEDKDEEK